MTDADDQKVILDVEDSSYLSVNRAGRLLLDALHEDVVVSRLVDLLEDEFGIDREAAKRDCAAFLGQLDERGWLVHGQGGRAEQAGSAPAT